MTVGSDNTNLWAAIGVSFWMQSASLAAGE